MQGEDVLKVASWCYSWVDRETWQLLTDDGTWIDFVQTISEELNREHRACISDALINPPSYMEKQQFASHCFTGGLPDSAMPVESLYCPLPPGAQVNTYMREPALYMKDLLKSLSLELPDVFRACPDHLSLELEVASLLLKSGQQDEARDFIAVRFTWLSDYLKKLESISVDTTFYEALTCALVSYCEALAAGEID